MAGFENSGMSPFPLQIMGDMVIGEGSADPEATEWTLPILVSIVL